MAYLPRTPSTAWNGNQDFDWSLVALGRGTFGASGSNNTNTVATVVQLDPLTGSLLGSYALDPTGP